MILGDHPADGGAHRVTGYHGGASKSLVKFIQSIEKTEAVYLLIGAEYIPNW